MNIDEYKTQLETNNKKQHNVKFHLNKKFLVKSQHHIM